MFVPVCCEHVCNSQSDMLIVDYMAQKIQYQLERKAQNQHAQKLLIK